MADSNEDVEALRRRVWIYHNRGMTQAQIGQAVGRAVSTVRALIKSARKEAYTQLDSAGKDEVIGDVLLSLKEMRQEALRNMTRCEHGSPMRAQWHDRAHKVMDQEIKFLCATGIIEKAPDKLDVSVADVRKMSDEEIQREARRLRDELVDAPIEVTNRLTAQSN